MLECAMRHSVLFVGLALALTACPGVRVPEPSLPVADADFSGALAQAPTGGPLGLTPRFTGKVANWRISSPRPVSLEWPQKTLVGTIDGGGNYDVVLPTRLPEAQQKTLRQLVRQFNILQKDDCSIDTLVTSTPDALAGKVEVLSVSISGASSGAGLQPQFSPPPPYDVFSPFTRYFNATEMLLYSSVAATAKGELSCTSQYLSGSRYHLFVNIALAQGWNSATLLYGAEQTIGGERVQRMLLKGGLGRSGLD